MSQKLSTKTKILYGAGDTGFSLTSTILGAYFAIFLTDVVGLAPGIAAAAIFIGRSWDYINDPIIGHISDRTRTRWGRRRPFLLFGALPFAAAFTLLWWKPPLGTQTALAVYYALAYLLFDTAATFAYMPYFALTPELTVDYDERTALTGYRMFFSIFASLLSFTLPLMIIGSFNPGNESKVLQMGLIFGALSCLPLFLTFFGTREQTDHLALDRPSFKQSLRAARNNRPFVFSAVIYLFTWVSISILETTLLFFIKYIVQRESQSDLLMASIFVAAIIALPFWSWTSRNWDKKKAYIAGIAFWAVVQMVLITLSPATSLPVLLTLCILAGIGVGAAHVLPWAIIPDAVEWDEYQTGQRHEGIFYSLIMLMQKIASSIAIPLVLLLLEFTGYIPNADQQGPQAITGIKIVVGPVPAILLSAAIVFAFLYPLGREKHAEIVQELDRRRKAAVSEVP
ncbi:MAG: MFS transporter [Anaerolineales bacterium]|nr:MFS transporter [Anaerolineales bacterium]